MIFSEISDAVHILDVSVFLLTMILSELSRRIGKALNVPHFYHYYYTCAALLVFLFIVDLVFPIVVPDTTKSEVLTVTLALRAGLVLSTFPIAMIYWRWLFSENLKR
jgi:hypothetical protein